MNEIEKMLAGELYDANYNSELTKKRLKAKELCKNIMIVMSEIVILKKQF